MSPEAARRDGSLGQGRVDVSTHCTFCDIVAGRIPASLVFQDDVCSAFMDIQPVNSGHVLVVPKQHFASLRELEPAAGAHMFEVAQRIARALRESTLDCEGINLFLADGAVAGQEVMHVHLHVLPRHRGDGFGLRFGPQYRQRPSRAELDMVAERIRVQL